ncbi:glycosyltransferase [Gluconacetobacter azotocaptans]|uniref:Glycosyltransferase n=1 Tax=Gluconacetobacter azotocaptans TaxID=142834 RepID=A0A7W4JVS9_9PROT|nr:glycosyltransferase family 2 protein [Gluconacetobacter azotocaptans]MBB2191707.1 glycosyltransferase [Gluconacetobacter azotocaptans]MBM9403187.1 glycosyltransferase family 2 protein [Gluconacetobacter azotocaptans]
MSSPVPLRQLTNFQGHFDGVTGRLAVGWAFDANAPEDVTELHVLIDEQEVGTIRCGQPRPDVQQVLGTTATGLGFAFPIPDQFIDDRPHSLSLRFPDRSVVPTLDPEDPSRLSDSCTFRIRSKYEYRSFVDGLKSGALRGWIQRIDTLTGEVGGHCHILVTMDDAPIAQVRADRYRGDVTAAIGGEANCGFELVVPNSRRRFGAVRFRFFVMPENVELGGSPVETSIVTDQLEGRLLDLSATIARLHGEITSLRRQMVDLIPSPGYNLGDYDRWARAYYDSLRARMAERRAADGHPAAEPLVSVICPTYKPEMNDFTAAVESVIAQTYRNWELIIVDDGMKSVPVAARIEEYCRADSRIRSVPLKKNLGIAGATNVGLKAARGEWIVFFDHDDLLVDVALEVMVADARRTGAKILYSDEDKIDQAGYFLEPNLKPDFNYRYLLGCNYICHLMMVDAAVMRAVGEIRSEYDGAQDHDLVLRLTEAVPHAQIHHVPEVLYHWRKTPNSTAVAIGNKTYAIDAGVRCVGDHLKRVGKKASVSSLRGLTLYRVDWKAPRAQPSVTVIIPFKDQIDITRRCVETVLATTDYRKYDIILVNNWSLTREAELFCAEMAATPRVRVLTVEEGFNYSRLNNLATRDSSADFYFFMNNDVFVRDAGWLKTLVNEAMSCDDIGIVGGKLLYPNDTVQHVGVVVGPAGVAAHVHRGLDGNEYGFIGRAQLSHEVSAVTAAGMLIRADLFRALGGFDEQNLTVAYNDVDLCLRVREAGYRIIQCNEFVAYHHESLSRGSDNRPETEARFFAETQFMQEKWRDRPIYRNDPAYSRHFTVDLQPFFDLADPAAPPS